VSLCFQFEKVTGLPYGFSGWCREAWLPNIFSCFELVGNKKLSHKEVALLEYSSHDARFLTYS